MLSHFQWSLSSFPLLFSLSFSVLYYVHFLLLPIALTVILFTYHLPSLFHPVLHLTHHYQSFFHCLPFICFIHLSHLPLNHLFKTTLLKFRGKVIKRNLIKIHEKYMYVWICPRMCKVQAVVRASDFTKSVGQALSKFR